MSEFVEFGSKTAADSARDEYEQYLCPVDDDKRKKEVAFISDTPESVLESVRLDAEEDRTARESTTGQAALTDREREQIDFSREGANVPKARSVKGIADEMGVDQWVEAFDPSLEVDEHRGVLETFNRSTAGDRVERNDDQRRQRQAAARQSSQQCNHAEGACANGDADACEFLQTACGFSESEVNELLPTATDGGVATDRDDADPLVVDTAAVPSPDEMLSRPTVDDRPAEEIESDQEASDDGMIREPEIDDDQGRLDDTAPFVEDDADLTGTQLGALSRAANGYNGAVAELREAVMTAKEAMKNAQMAAEAIDGIREEAGQPPTHFTALEEANAAVMDLVRMSAEVCVECHGEHADHDHDVTDGDREDLREFVGGGATGTPVGVSDETEDKITNSLDVPEMVAGFELTDPDPRNLVYESGDGRRVEIYSHGGDMSHHYSAILRDDGGEAGELASATADRMMADDMGAEQNRERAVDAAVDYMRSEPADGSVESPSTDVGRSIQMPSEPAIQRSATRPDESQSSATVERRVPDEPAIQREATGNVGVEPLVETDLPTRLTQSFALIDFGDRFAVYRDDDGAEIEVFAVDGEPRFRITDTEGRTRDEGRAGGLVPALEEARQRVDRMARESRSPLRLSDVAVPDSIGQFGFVRRDRDAATYSHPATGDKIVLSDTDAGVVVELIVRGDTERTEPVDDVRAAVEIAEGMAEGYQRRRDQTRDPPVDTAAVPSPDERLSSASTEISRQQPNTAVEPPGQSFATRPTFSFEPFGGLRYPLRIGGIPLMLASESDDDPKLRYRFNRGFEIVPLSITVRKVSGRYRHELKQGNRVIASRNDVRQQGVVEAVERFEELIRDRTTRAERARARAIDSVDPTSAGRMVERDESPDRSDVVDLSQRTLGGGTRAQSTLVGGETGERGQGEVESAAVDEVNDGGLMADTRDDPTDFDPDEDTEQMVPDEFQTTDNDQNTL